MYQRLAVLMKCSESDIALFSFALVIAVNYKYF